MLLLKNYLGLLNMKCVDTIVLGCTHYSFLTAQIRQIIGDSTALIDTSYAIAEQLERVLKQGSLRNTTNRGSISYFTTGSIDDTRAAINSLLGYKVTVSPL